MYEYIHPYIFTVYYIFNVYISTVVHIFVCIYFSANSIMYVFLSVYLFQLFRYVVCFRYIELRRGIWNYRLPVCCAVVYNKSNGDDTKNPGVVCFIMYTLLPWVFSVSCALAWNGRASPIKLSLSRCCLNFFRC